ncbi:MAG: FAD-dependent oxidoreductase [Thermodesulfobacteriota bacterium]|nr:FAD-dependent oxidoreductase [Thermodesulfobacteriota bacterium]
MVAGQATLEASVRPDIMFDNAGVRLLYTKANGIDIQKKVVMTSDGDQIHYDKLLIATGARPIIPSIKGIDAKGVFTLRTGKDASLIAEYIKEQEVKSFVVVGGGAIGLEVGSLLAMKGLKFTMVEALKNLVQMQFDREFSEEIEGYLVLKGVQLILKERVSAIIKNNGTLWGVELSIGERFPTDMVILAVGAKANLELATDIGLEIGSAGIKVNEYMETSIPDIFAAGDCVETPSFITQKPIPGQLRSHAVIQGRLVAKRIAGYDIQFPGILNCFATKIFDQSIASVGLTEAIAQKEGIETISAVVSSRNKHIMMEGVMPYKLKLVFDKDSKQLIGGQIISDSDMPIKEIDTINCAILSRATVENLTTFMCAGHPEISPEPSAEPITLAAEEVLQKMRNKTYK